MPPGIFYIAGCAPTDAERAAAEALGLPSFRNARFFDKAEPYERVAVSKEVAARYAELIKEAYGLVSFEPEPDGEPEAEPEAVGLHVVEEKEGGWYVLSDGQKVHGKAALAEVLGE